MLISAQKDSIVSSGYKYLINYRHTIDITNYLIRNNKDTINYITSDGEKIGYWEEWVYGIKYSGIYINGLKHGTWKSNMSESIYENGWLKESISYCLDMDNNVVYLSSTFKLNKNGDVFIKTSYMRNGMVGVRKYYKAPDKSKPFNGFDEQTSMQNFIKKEEYDENGKLIKGNR